MTKIGLAFEQAEAFINGEPLADAPPFDGFTELQLADRVVRRFGDRLRYCGSLGGWYIWTGTHWAADESEKARESVKRVAYDLAAEAAESLDVGKFKQAKRAGSAAGVRAILELARSTPGIVFTPEDADRDPWALNVVNGTLDLRTGQLRAHDPDDLITRCCAVEYDPGAPAPIFDKFSREIQPSQEIRDYLRRVFGYAASGVIREHALAVLWGPGANGKSVLADVVTHALGD